MYDEEIFKHFLSWLRLLPACPVYCSLLCIIIAHCAVSVSGRLAVDSALKKRIHFIIIFIIAIVITCVIFLGLSSSYRLYSVKYELPRSVSLRG